MLEIPRDMTKLNYISGGQCRIEVDSNPNVKMVLEFILGSVSNLS